MNDDLTQEHIKQIIKDCLDDKDVMIHSVDFCNRSTEGNVCEMRVIFDIENERTIKIVKNAFDKAMEIVK